MYRAKQKESEETIHKLERKGEPRELEGCFH